MQFLEENMIRTWNGTTPKNWVRYIDDIWFILEGTEEELFKFVDFLNCFHSTIEFTMEYDIDRKSCNFLDTTVWIDSEGFIKTDLYTKPCAKIQYLLPTSGHPRHTFQSIPYSLMMRLRRICSTEELFDFRMDQLKNHLLSRGYNMGILEKARERIKQVSREKALERVELAKIQRQCFVTEYHPSLPEMGRIIRKHWSVMIERDGRLKECFPRPSMTAYRRGKSLKELLCRARMPNKERRSVRQAERQGFYSCGWPLCNLCPFVFCVLLILGIV